MKQTAIRHLWPLLALALLVWGAPAAAQTGAAMLRVEPESLSLAAGETQTVAIVIQDAAEVYGIDVRAAFDPALVEIVDADPARDGVQMTPGVLPQPDFMALNAADNSAGALRYAVTQVNPTPPASGGGVVFSFQVRGRANGVSPLRLTLVEMANRSGELLPVTTRDGAITVTGGQPPAATGVAVTIPAESGRPSATADTTTAPAPTAAAETTVAAEAATATTAAAPAATIVAATATETTTGPADSPTAPPQPAITDATGSVALATATAAPTGEANAAATLASAVVAETTANPAAATTTAAAGDTAAGASAPPAVVGAGTDATGPNAATPADTSPGGALLIGGVVVLLLVTAVTVLAWRGRR